ncbi:MAG: hypothetical protein ISP90_13505 [Nevskia sp.]|nr:hypothetical protein [Nevskia sp.]
MLQDYPGGCHCGAVEFVYCTALAPSQWQLRACQCSFCTAHAGLTTSDPQGSVGFLVRRPDALQHYRFGMRSADFLVCRQCGVYVGVCSDTDQGQFAVVNVRALRPRPAGLPEAVAVTFSGESLDQRLARRKLLWTPVKDVL